jgi:antitoxin HigA-1
MASFNPPIHPGEILREEFMQPYGIRAYTLAGMLGVPRTRIERIAAETGPVTPDTALRLARLFGTTPLFWLQMQASYDLAVASKAVADDIEKIAPLKAAA